jgi:general secretion pathway protein L
MSEILVIRLLSAPDAETHVASAQWLIVDHTGARKGNVESGFLSEAAAFTPNRKVVALVPGTDVLLAEPTLPLKSGTKLLQIVPFALEEQLATDVEDLHFAVGKRGDAPGTPVAAIARARMESYRTAMQVAHIEPDAMYAESAVVPATPGAVTLLLERGRVFVRRAGSPGAVLEVEPLIEALQLALASGEEAREHVTIYVDEEGYERDLDLLEGLREYTASLQLKLMSDGALPLLASAAAKTNAVNLLQGAFSAKTRLNLSFAPWRYVAALAAALIVLHLGLKGWQYVSLKRTETALDASIAQIFQAAMPGEPVPDSANARRQFEARLNLIRPNAAGGLIPVLEVLAVALSETPGASLQAISYRDNVTNLRIVAPSVDALDHIRKVAAERGVTASIESTTPRDSKTEGRLKLTSPGA